MKSETAKELLRFIKHCPSSFHTVKTVSDLLVENGYTKLSESTPWTLQAGGKYFVTRNHSSVIAFQIPYRDFSAFLMTASHSESPAFKIKPDPEMPVRNYYVKLNTEKYGGMLYTTWLDRPLSVAGRIVVKIADGIETKLVDIDRDLLMIPNLAIHMCRSANEGIALNPQTDLLPLFGGSDAAGSFRPMIADAAGVKPEQILGSDLFLYCRTPGSIWGSQKEFLSAPRLDDLECVFATLKGFLAAKCSDAAPVFCVFDNEEVGSGTKQGAKSTFLADTLYRICHGMNRDYEDYLRTLASSFMLSADNGHAVHPNHLEKSDPTHQPVLNGGVLIKYNANQRYTTDAVSEAIFRQICKNADIPVQKYVNRSDIPGGSTLGNLSGEKVSVCCADIGLAQLAMHSAYETAGCMDLGYLCRAAEAFYQTHLRMSEDGNWEITGA